MKKLTQQTPRRATGTIKRRKAPKINDEEERLYRPALLYLLRHHGMFLVPTAVHEVQVRGQPVWIFTVTLRYDIGHEGYIGDLLYDGEQFTFLTEESVRKDRARKITEDPEGQRKWNEYRASTPRTGKR